MAHRLKGKPVIAALKEELTDRVAVLASRGTTPTLAIVRVGERPDDLSYERTAIKRAEGLNIAVRVFALPETASQEEPAGCYFSGERQRCHAWLLDVSSVACALR